MGLYKNNNPGSGTYKVIKSIRRDEPKYSFGSRNGGGKDKLKVPGPGRYNHKSNITKRPSSKFGRAKRNVGSDKFRVPGPG